MAIWGHRDSEPPPEVAHEAEPGADETRQPAGQEHQAEEPAPAFWRAQGETPASFARDPADAPPPAYGYMPEGPPAGAPPPAHGYVPEGSPAGAPAPAHGQRGASEAPARADSESPAGADAPVPVLTGVVVDGETAVKDPALTGTPGDQAWTHDAETGPVVTGVEEPTVAVAREPVVAEAQEPASAAQEPVVAVQEPVAAAHEPAVAHEPVSEAQEPVAEAQEPVAEGGQVVPGAHEPAAAPAAAAAASPAAAPASASGISAQRWSEILVAFVDDPRGSVQMAADIVDEAIGEFVNSVRARQRDLASTWQGAEADTEQLRTALREYRKLGQRVQQLDLGEKTGG